MRVKATIAGVTPILMNRFTAENEVDVTSGSRPAHKGDQGSPREQAEKKLYADSEGKLYIPGPNIFACLIEAGKYHKLNKKQVTTQKRSMVPAGLSVEEIVCPLKTPGWEVDSRSVVNPSTGGRIMCHRPRCDKWELTFTLDIDETLFSPKFVRQLVDDAGKRVGLGDYRPDRKGPFGKFVVKGWRELKR
jgi:hypothetical protein